MSLLLCQGGRTPLASVLAERVLADGGDRNGDSNFANLKTSLKEMLTEANRSSLPVSIILADHWVRYFMVTPPLDARAVDDCQSAVALRFKTLYGESMDAWHLAADWDARNSFLSCATPKALFAALQETANEHKLTLTGILPYFIANLNRWRHQVKDGDWFATILDQQMTLGIADRGRLSAVRSTPLSENDLQSRTWLCEYAEREAMRMNWPEPYEIKLCGEVPESWLGASAGKIHCIRLNPDIEDISIRPMNAGILLASCGMRR